MTAKTPKDPRSEDPGPEDPGPEDPGKDGPDKPDSHGRKPGRGLFVALFALGCVILIGLAWRAPILIEQQTQARIDALRAESQQRALVGGPFTLVDHQGRTVRDEEFRGRHMLVFFGFTYCPDVCPDSLMTITQALDMLDDSQREKLAPLFVTVDPERDGVEQMESYMSHFHPDLLGLTGTPEQIAEVAQAYRVFYSKVPLEGTDTYTMDHSSIIYLMDENGEYAAHFTHGTTPEDIVRALRARL